MDKLVAELAKHGISAENLDAEYEKLIKEIEKRLLRIKIAA